MGSPDWYPAPASLAGLRLRFFYDLYELIWYYDLMTMALMCIPFHFFVLSFLFLSYALPLCSPCSALNTFAVFFLQDALSIAFIVTLPLPVLTLKVIAVLLPDCVDCVARIFSIFFCSTSPFTMVLVHIITYCNYRTTTALEYNPPSPCPTSIHQSIILSRFWSLLFSLIIPLPFGSYQPADDVLFFPLSSYL